MADQESRESVVEPDPFARALELLRREAHNRGGEAGREYADAADALEGVMGEGDRRSETAGWRQEEGEGRG